MTQYFATDIVDAVITDAAGLTCYRFHNLPEGFVIERTDERHAFFPVTFATPDTQVAFTESFNGIVKGHYVHIIEPINGGPHRCFVATDTLEEAIEHL